MQCFRTGSKLLKIARCFNENIALRSTDRTWFSATEEVSQSVCQLKLTLIQSLCKIRVPFNPENTIILLQNCPVKGNKLRDDGLSIQVPGVIHGRLAVGVVGAGVGAVDEQQLDLRRLCSAGRDVQGAVSLLLVTQLSHDQLQMPESCEVHLFDHTQLI